MSARGSLAHKSPSKVWSDGIHLVRPVADTDDHPMRWLVAAHQKTGSRFKRYVPTSEEAIFLAIEATQRHLRKAPESKTLFDPPTVSPTASIQVDALPKEYRVLPAERPQVLPKFAITHFHCIRANPVAQVWQCVSYPGEFGAAGRRKANGGAPVQAAFNHTKGECAILLWQEPVRDEDGSVKVYASWQIAEQAAFEMYYATDEEERIFWREDDPCVARTLNVNIMFDPNNVDTTVRRPFYLFIPRYNKPVLAGYRKKVNARATRLLSGSEYIPSSSDEKAALDFNRKLAAMDDDENNRTLSLSVATFKTIWGAEEHAINITERVLRGERVEL